MAFPIERMLGQETKNTLLNRKNTSINNKKRTVSSRVSEAAMESLSRNSSIMPGPSEYVFNIEEIESFIESNLNSLMRQLREGKQEFDPVFFQLVEVVFERELLYTPFAPKNPLSNFASKGGTIFLSKKKPLLIVADLADATQMEAFDNKDNCNVSHVDIPDVR